MSSAHDHALHGGHFKEEPPFPWMHVIGFILSLILTFAALWLGLAKTMSVSTIMWIILVFAIVQIAVQLFFFMHVTEKVGHTWHIWMLALALFFTFAIIAGSVWIMTFGWTEAY